MTSELKNYYICEMLLAENRESYISNAMAAFPQGDRVELEKLADEVWEPSSGQAKNQQYPKSL